MTEPSGTSLGPKALKTAGIILISLAALLLVALVVLYFFAEPLAARYIKQQVSRQTEGLYQIDFNELKLHLRTRSITLQEVHLYPDTTVARQLQEKGKASRNLFDIQIPSIKVKHINLIALIFNDQLSLNTVVIVHPVIEQLQAGNADKAQNRGSKAGSMEVVLIRQLALQGGSYRLLVKGQRDRPQHKIANFSLQAQDFRLNLKAKENISKMLQADAVDLKVQNYTYHSPDSVYAIHLGRFFYSSRQHALKAIDLEVQPDILVNSSIAKDRAHHFVYQLKIPSLNIRGLDVAEAWQTKQLHLDRLLLDKSTLYILEDLTVPDSTSSPKLAELYADLSPYLKSIGIKTLRLTDSRFNYRQKNGGIHTLHNIDKANLELQALQLDSATLFTPKEKAFADAMTLTTDNYTYSPLTNPYALKIGNMNLSTRDKTLQVADLHLTGDWGKNDKLKNLGKAKHTFYDINLTGLRFNELDLMHAVRTSQLKVGSITAVQPKIDIRTDRQVPKQEVWPGLQELYQQVSSMVTKLEVGEVSITDAALTQHTKSRNIQLIQQLDHTSLTATGLIIDSAFIFDPNRKLPLQNLVVTARNYRYQMPDNSYSFALTGLRYSARQKEFSASSVKVISSGKESDRQNLFSDASRTVFDLSANMLRVTGMDLFEALNTRQLQADQVLLRQPDVAILLDRKVASSIAGAPGAKEGLFDLLDNISVNNIRLEDASFAFSEKLEPVMRTHLLERATITVSGFNLTATSFANLGDALPMEEMTLLAENYTYWSTDSLYTIRLDSVYYNSRLQEVIAHTFSVIADRRVNERLKAETPDLASRNLVDISAKQSHIIGFNLINAYATGQYHMRKLLLTGPKVTILQDHNVTPAVDKATAVHDTTTIAASIPQLTDMESTFRVERLEVTDGTFDFHILEDTIRVSQTLDHVALMVDQLRLISLEANDPLDIFDADDIGILVKGYTFFTRDSLYALEVKEMRASMHNRSLSVDSLRLRPLYSKEQYATLFRYARDRIDLTVPGIEVQEISLRALFNNQEIIAHKMLIQNPEVEIYRDNRLGINPELRPPTLQSALREAGIYIRLDTILMEKNILKHPVIAIDGVKPAIFLLDNIRMQAFNVTNDTALIRQNNMITVNASALFMGVSNLQANFQFQMDHPEDRYTYEGTLEPMDFTALNPLLENMVFIRINRGQIHNASFKIEATGKEASGQVHFPYNNLKVQLLNKHDPNNPGLLLKAGTKLINMLIIKSNNPSAWGKFREGNVNERRDPERSVTYHMSQSMLDGVTSSLMTKLVQRIVSRFVEL